VGVGNSDLGDDAFGIRLAESLADPGGAASVVQAGTTPERWMDSLAGGRFDNVVFLDAVRTQASPGSVVVLDAAQIEAAYPQISTHKISLGTLARLIAAEGRAAVWLLGVVPESLRSGDALSGTVEASRAALCVVIHDVLEANQAAVVGSVRS
jgi:hydrogenase 3 maturation protease